MITRFTPLLFFLFGTTLAAQDLVITEIFYNTPGSGNDTIEYLEIFNNSNLPVNLEGYQMATAVVFTFPQITLQPDSFLLISKFSQYTLQYLNKQSLQWTSGSLNNAGERIDLLNDQGNVIDSVRYYPNTHGWDTMANGKGFALVLCDLNADNALASNWTVVHEYMGFFVDSLFGNPGRGCLSIDTVLLNRLAPVVNEKLKPASSGVIVSNIDAPHRLEVYNVLGVRCYDALVERNGYITFDLQPGLYFARLSRNGISETVRLVANRR